MPCEGHFRFVLLFAFTRERLSIHIWKSRTLHIPIFIEALYSQCIPKLHLEHRSVDSRANRNPTTISNQNITIDIATRVASQPNNQTRKVLLTTTASSRNHLPRE